MGSTLLQPTISPRRRLWTMAAAVLFLVAWALRLATLHSAFHPDDSPETILAGALAGIQHPPGYPLYTLLTRLAHLTLPGAAPFQTNLLAAGVSSLSVVLLVWLALAWSRALPGPSLSQAWPQRLGVISLALGSLSMPQLWFQGLSAKGGIYGLNLSITLACLGLFWQASRSRSIRALEGGALLAGLGLANHYMSFVLFIPAMAWWSWKARPGLRAQGRLAVWLLPGLSLYLYLPLRAAQHPALNWGDPETLGRLWQTILRSQYAAAETARHFSKTLELTRYFLRILPNEVPWLGLALAVLGIQQAWGRLEAGLRPFLYCLALHLFLVLNYNNPPLPWVINAFFLPDFALLWLLAALSLGALWPRLHALHPQGALIAAFLALTGLVALLPARYRANDYSRDYLLYDYNRDILQGLADHSALLASGGNDAFGLWYLQALEHRRQDLAVVDVPLIGDWYLEQLRLQLPELDPAWTTRDRVVQGLLAAPKRPLFYTSHNPGDRGIPLGLVSYVPVPGQSLPLSVEGLLARFQIMRLRWAADDRTPWDGNREELTEYYSFAAQALGAFGQRQGVRPLVEFGGQWDRRFKATREGQRDR